MNTHDIDQLIDKIEASAAMDIAGRSKYIHDLRAALRPEVTEFELIQDGIPVAGASGKREDAWREIQHYAAQYSEDGPVEIYEVTRRRIEGEGK